MKIKFDGKVKDLHPVYANRLLEAGKAKRIDEQKKAGRPKSGRSGSEPDDDKSK